MHSHVTLPTLTSTAQSTDFQLLTNVFYLLLKAFVPELLPTSHGSHNKFVRAISSPFAVAVSATVFLDSCKLTSTMRARGLNHDYYLMPKLMVLH